jgi:hypothetical protein
MEHHVYFWLKDEYKNEDARASFEQGLDSLLTVPGLEKGFWGRPAAVMIRPVVDLSWDYGTSFTFASVEAHDAYQVHPEHQVFIDKHKEKWARVLVTDIEPNR